MPGGLIVYGLLTGLAIALAIAAFTDLRSRQIYNWLTVTVAVAAPIFWIASGLPLWPGIATQLGITVLCFGICCGLFALGQMGGGDVKLLTALALWFPPMLFLKLAVLMALIGGVLTIVFGAWHIARRQKEKLAIPYGLAIASAGLWVLAKQFLSTAPSQFALG